MFEPGKIWWNWFGELFFIPQYQTSPEDAEGVRAAIREARRRGLPIRAAGAGHSNPAIVPTPGLHIDTSRLNKILSVDKEKRQVTFQPGIRVGELSRYLATCGMSLNNQGDIDTQAAAGAIMTGTHGAGKTLPCMSAQLIAAIIVTADGSFLELSERIDKNLFNAFQTSIGMFGVIVSMTIQAVPSYNIHKRSWNADTEDCLANLQDLLNENRTFWFFWLPLKESAELYELPAGIPSKTTRAHDICHMRAYNAVPADQAAPALQPGEAFGHSSVIFPNIYLPNYREMEYAIPFARFEECFTEIRHLIQTKYPKSVFPIECRAVKADNTWLSAYADRDGYAISVTGPLEQGTWKILSDVDEIFDRYEGRPHWGKQHFMTPQRLEKLYPNYDAFKRLRRELDPDNVFLNDHLRPLFI